MKTRLPEIPEGFRFQSVDHRYFLGAREIRGVSKVLEDGGIKPPFFGTNREALVLGTAVHELTEHLDRGTSDQFEYHDRVLEYRAGWQAFRGAFPYECLEIEVPRTIRIPGAGDYAGTPDRVVLWGKRRRLAILEVKTGQRYAWHRYQVSLYSHLVGGKALRIAVYLAPTYVMGFEIEQFEDSADWERSRAALIVASGKPLRKDVSHAE